MVVYSFSKVSRSLSIDSSFWSREIGLGQVAPMVALGIWMSIVVFGNAGAIRTERYRRYLVFAFRPDAP